MLQEVLVEKFAFHCVSHILDDFIFLAPAGSKLCQQQLDCFIAVAEYTGILIKSSKTVTPCCVAPIHGIEVDTCKFVAHLPGEKITGLISLLSAFKDGRSVKLRAWQSLIGHMNFASRVMRLGHPFIRRFIDCIKGVTNPHHHIKLNSLVRKDIRVWLLFLRQYNEVSLIPPLVDLSYDQHSFQSDASGWGCVVICKDQWFHLQCSGPWLHVHISIKEFLPIILALHLWGSQWWVILG